MQSETQKVDYVIGYLEAWCDDRANDAAGLATPAAGYHQKQRALNCLIRNHSPRDSSRLGAPRYYGDEILEKAETMLLDDTMGMLTGEEQYTPW